MKLSQHRQHVAHTKRHCSFKGIFIGKITSNQCIQLAALGTQNCAHLLPQGRDLASGKRVLQHQSITVLAATTAHCGALSGLHHLVMLFAACACNVSITCIVTDHDCHISFASSIDTLYSITGRPQLNCKVDIGRGGRTINQGPFCSAAKQIVHSRITRHTPNPDMTACGK